MAAATHWETFVAASDLHGDQLHRPTVERFLRFADDFNPTYRIFLGDVFDLRPLRRGAGPEDRRQSIREDVGAGKRFIERYFSKGKKKFLTWGNHDICRLEYLRDSNDGIMADVANDAINDITTHTDKLGVSCLPYHKRDGVLRIGHLKLLHGFYCGINAAKQHATTYNSCLFGHVHVIDQAPVAGLERRVARCIGALCELSMGYNDRNPNTLRQAHGWAYGAIHKKTGEFFVRQAEEINGKWSEDVL